MTTFSPGWSRRRGQSMVEFALILPLVLMILASLMELGRYARSKQGIQNLTREMGMLAMHRVDNPTGTNFPNVIRAAGVTALPVNITNDARFYVGQVMRTPPLNNAVIVQYDQVGNLVAPAQVLGAGLNGIATLPANCVLETNQIMYVVEAFYRFSPVLPFAWRGWQAIVPGTNKVYDVAFF
jgi:hypothetical protein